MEIKHRQAQAYDEKEYRRQYEAMKSDRIIRILIGLLSDCLSKSPYKAILLHNGETQIVADPEFEEFKGKINTMIEQHINNAYPLLMQHSH